MTTPADASQLTVVELSLDGQLTEQRLGLQLSALGTRVEEGNVGLLVNALEMSGYEPAARDRFVQWNREHVHVVQRVAVVTRNRMWHVVVRAMGLASTQQMRPFPDVASARRWLQRAS